MALPDISNLTLDELQELMVAASVQYKQTEANQLSEINARIEAIIPAIAGLENLLGPADATANTNNIRGVLGFTDVQMAANAGLAFRLAFLGLERLTEITLDIAKVVASR